MVSSPMPAGYFFVRFFLACPLALPAHDVRARSGSRGGRRGKEARGL
jgi:hypothetical protein